MALGLDFEAKLTVLEPASARVGPGWLTVVARGTGLVYWYGLCWNGTPLDTTFTVDGAGLSGMVPGELRSRAGTAEVRRPGARCGCALRRCLGRRRRW